MWLYPVPFRTSVRIVLAVLLVIILTFPCPRSYGVSSDFAEDISELYKRLSKITGQQDSVIISYPGKENLIAINADQMLVPASILKILTSLAAIETLGADFRIKTEFYKSPQGDLIIKGFGDPFLVSEEIDVIAGELAGIIQGIKDIVIDPSYFSGQIILPGRNNTPEPYDAPNSALCVNFNTVSFKREQGRWISAEPQTPLLPFVIPRIEASGMKEGRITLASNGREGLEYAGEMFKYFLDQKGIIVKGSIHIGNPNLERDSLILIHESRFTVLQTVQKLLEYSNNFIANQLLLVMGAQQYGAPSTLIKGVNVLEDFCTHRLGIEKINLAEGSGLSRKNRISARSMLAILEYFFPYRHLLKSDGRQQYKTGTLWKVSTRAGYLNSQSDKVYMFVVMRNSKGKSAGDVARIIEQYLK